jgi:myo-inositol-1(or 4)-monophosphatase
MNDSEIIKLLLDLTSSIRRAIIQMSRDDSARVITRRRANDVTRRIDEVAEEEAINYLENLGISALMISEESPSRIIGSDPEIALVLDPLDGSMNFVNSIPFYSVSAAMGIYKSDMRLSDLTVGVVRDIVNGDAYSAASGMGAFHNDRPLIANSDQTIIQPLLSFYSYGHRELPIKIGKLQEFTKYRTLGSASLEICYVATGNLDAMIDTRGYLRVVDFAAGKIILEEADGLFTDINGKKIDQKIEDQTGTTLIASANKRIHEWLLQLMWS